MNYNNVCRGVNIDVDVDLIVVFMYNINFCLYILLYVFICIIYIVRSTKSSTGQFEEGLSLLSNDSSYTLELMNNNLAPLPVPAMAQKGHGHAADQFKTRLENDFGVSRDHAMMGALSHMVNMPNPNANGHGNGNKLNNTKSNKVKATARSKRTLGKLVAARAKHEALGDLFNQCAINCSKGCFIPQGPYIRSIEELTETSANYIASNNMEQSDFYDTFSSIQNGGEPNSENTVFHGLIRDLVCCPETYLVISDIMSGVQSKKVEGNILSAPPSPGPAGPDNINDDVIQFHNITTDDSGANTKESYAYERSGDVIKQTYSNDGTGGGIIEETPGPLAVDKDIFAYLNVNSERRHTRKEFKKSGGNY